ncbi:hypothetical protein ACP6JB_000983 [Aspergillus fumigatus]
MESQLSVIDLLTAMFPSPGEIDIPASTNECTEKLRNWCGKPSAVPSGIPSTLHLAVCLPIAGGEKSIQVNISIPVRWGAPDTAQPPPLSYSLRQPDWMSKAELATLAAAMPLDDVFEAFGYVQDEALRFLEAQRASESETTKTSSGPIVRVWFYFPSLSTREKRNDLVNHAPDYSLTGFVLAGKPGVLCLEGASTDIDAYMSFIKTHSWSDIPSHQKKVSERYRETNDVQRVFSGMEEITDSLGERSGHRANRGDMQALETWLQARGLHEAFSKHYSRYGHIWEADIGAEDKAEIDRDENKPHFILFKFRPEVTQEHKDTFVRELKKLKDLDCVKGHRLVVGGPSITDPIARSKGFEIALLSFHENREALEAYQASKEHHWVTSTYMFPYKEDLIRFDFEVAPEDEYMWNFLSIDGLAQGLAKE